MDELKHRAGEKFEALHEAAKIAAGDSKSRVQDVFNHTAETIRKIREAFSELWHNELITEGRARVVAWSRDALQRLRDGAPPLSPLVLYDELVALFKDRMWRRSVAIFLAGAVLGGGAGLCAGLRAARPAAGPQARALHSQPDRSVLLVEDAPARCAGAGEVLVRVQAFSVCSVDRAVLRGRGAALRALLSRPAVTVGRGFAGVVLDVGPGVTSLELGDEVWGCVSEWSGGAATELLTIRSTRAGRRARGVGAAQGAALVWGGTRALRALRRLRCTPHHCTGKRVAVCGAASGEGCALVQLLAAWGARPAAAGPAAHALLGLGAAEVLELDGCSGGGGGGAWWRRLARAAARTGPWDAAVACPGADGADAGPDAAVSADPSAILKATAPRDAIVDLRPQPLLSDRLPAPFSLLFAISFHTYRLLRWMVGLGTHTDWLEDPLQLREGLDELAQLVDSGALSPLVDKVFLPVEYETALAHACSDAAIGTSVVRFP
ncbi:reticulon-4-interacting protein 1, mitochondrial-like isoform X1 [Galleria mellonella]|uniref:Reticulon-4-interacting protein 1, mitochondrial-like isoform X1 n=1 Tax=Galleria mellonella TaxID=7137 RepID=A0ABM3MB22_GALME|nr:reticulon-4-interacting protein 1, mitochondrial-like isoform X1 [Galleria mellonella]